MKLHQVMTRPVETLEASATILDAARRMRVIDVGLIPAMHGGRLAGVLTDRDIILRCMAAGRDPQATLVADCMTPEVLTCSADTEVDAAAELMGRRQVRRLVVTDDESRPIGIVSLGDLAVRAKRERVHDELLEDVSEPSRWQERGIGG